MSPEQRVSKGVFVTQNEIPDLRVYGAMGCEGASELHFVEVQRDDEAGVYESDFSAALELVEVARKKSAMAAARDIGVVTATFGGREYVLVPRVYAAVLGKL